MIATKDYIEKNFFISCYEEINGHTYAVLDDTPQYVGWDGDPSGNDFSYFPAVEVGQKFEDSPELTYIGYPKKETPGDDSEWDNMYDTCSPRVMD